MKKKVNFFIITSIILFFSKTHSNDIYQTIQPELSSVKESYNNLKFGKFQNLVVVTANDYATKIGYEILDQGGSVADAAVAIQLTLGLVEPQSSGIGGGIFLTYYDEKTKKKISYEGREKAPRNIKSDIFIDKNGKPKKFFEAAVGGASVGVPATLKALHKFHKDFGKLEWKEIIKPVINLSSNGFTPPNRLINAVNKERFLFDLYPKSIFTQIKYNSEKKFFNNEYTKTLKEISKGISEFYNGKIAMDITNEVNKSINSGKLSLEDLKEYKIKKKPALCHTLESGYKVCGPNLPSSGTICILQSLILFEEIFNKDIKSNFDLNENINEILDILNFIYYYRDLELADSQFINLDVSKILNKDYILKKFFKYKKSNKTVLINNFEEVFNSTSHFSLVDKYKNVLSATSSIESSFGSRLFTNGFFLNNQLTDFSFKTIDESGNLIKNSPAPGKKPLSSMSPLIIFDKNDDWLYTIGSPGGKAIISYVFKSLLSLIYMQENMEKAIKSPNYIRIKNKTFVENESFKLILGDKVIIRDLTSGIAIIKKSKNSMFAGADLRRDGTVRGK